MICHHGPCLMVFSLEKDYIFALYKAIKKYLIKQHAFIDFCMLLLGKAWHSTKYGRTDLLNLNNWGEGGGGGGKYM